MFFFIHITYIKCIQYYVHNEPSFEDLDADYLHNEIFTIITDVIISSFETNIDSIVNELSGNSYFTFHRLVQTLVNDYLGNHKRLYKVEINLNFLNLIRDIRPTREYCEKNEHTIQKSMPLLNRIRDLKARQKTVTNSALCKDFLLELTDYVIFYFSEGIKSIECEEILIEVIMGFKYVRDGLFRSIVLVECNALHVEAELRIFFDLEYDYWDGGAFNDFIRDVYEKHSSPTQMCELVFDMCSGDILVQIYYRFLKFHKNTDIAVEENLLKFTRFIDKVLNLILKKVVSDTWQPKIKIFEAHIMFNDIKNTNIYSFCHHFVQKNSKMSIPARISFYNRLVDLSNEVNGRYKNLLISFMGRYFGSISIMKIPHEIRIYRYQ